MREKQERPNGEDTEKYYTTTQALEVAKSAGLPVSRMTLISWVEKNELGFQPGGNDSNWFVNKEKFDNFIAGKGADHGATATA